MSEEVLFYFRKTHNDSPYVLRKYRDDGCEIAYMKDYSNAVLTNEQRETFKEWLSISKNKRMKLYQKYSKIQDPQCPQTDWGPWFLSANFTTEEDPVYKTVPQTPKLNAMCDYIATQSVSLSGINYRQSCVNPAPECEVQVLNIPRTDLVIMDDVSSNKTKKGNTMYYDDDDCDCTECRVDKLAPEKRYLISRTNMVEGVQARKIPTTYHLEDDPTPQTANDLLQRIKDGKFIVRKDKGDEVGGWPTFPLTFIEWRDPAVTKDIAGADKAREALETAVTKTMDTIVAGDVAAGLSAVQALETQTF